MRTHLQPHFDPLSAAAWNEIIPGEDESVFSQMVFCLGDDVKQALMSGATLIPPGQTMGHALIYAVWMRHFGLLKMMLEHGFDPNSLAWTAEGEIPGTALDAAAESYHDGEDKFDEMILDAMHALLRGYGGKYACELRVEPASDFPSSLKAERLKLEPLAWPDRLPEQVAILRKLIGGYDKSVVAPDAEALSAMFGRKNKKRTEQIEGILETLKELGQL